MSRHVQYLLRITQTKDVSFQSASIVTLLLFSLTDQGTSPLRCHNHVVYVTAFILNLFMFEILHVRFTLTADSVPLQKL